MPNDTPPTEDQTSSASPAADAERGRDNRGRSAGMTAAGEVVGSGAGAGGKGSPEDYDGDAQAGGGSYSVRHADRPAHGGDASQHNST